MADVFRIRSDNPVARPPSFGDPGSPQALDLARRALSLVGEFTRFDPELMASLKAVFQEGYSNPDIAPRMPYSQGMRQFMDAAVRNLHAVEG